MPGEIRVGTAGWNYPAGRGTWNGVFYPSIRGRGFDELAYYAEHFDTVEVNSTFYRMPDPGLSAKWLERTPSTFLFSVKLYQKFTHPDLYLARGGVSEWDVVQGDVDEFRLGIEPLAARDRLGAVLVQFPPSFHDGPETRLYLEWLLTKLAGYPLAIELRHRTWSDAAAETSRLLAAHQAVWALIDEPKFRDSVQQDLDSPVLPVRSSTSSGPPLTYLRLHGRNADHWWEHEEAEDRYDYSYSRAELAPFARTAAKARASGHRVLMYMNNHFSAKAVANAVVLKDELQLPVDGDYPHEMVVRYPELAGLVVTSGLPL
jgi:uncharacterized protein YecE (DUF72 family)